MRSWRQRAFFSSPILLLRLSSRSNRAPLSNASILTHLERGCELKTDLLILMARWSDYKQDGAEHLEGRRPTPERGLYGFSARKEGSWPQFRAAVERLDVADTTDEAEQDARLPLHQRVRFNLVRLGHVEFGAADCEEGWRVVPPSLAPFAGHGISMTMA